MKLKYQIPTSLEHLKPIIIRYIATVGLILIVFVGVANAMPTPESYGNNQCQKAAIDYQKEFGGSLIWIQPIDEHGNPILGEYNAHVINKIYNTDLKSFVYVDYPNKIISNANLEIKLLHGEPVRVYDLSKERPEFGLIWYY